MSAADTAFAIATIRARESDRPNEERLFDDRFAAIFAAAASAEAAEGTARFLALPMFADGIRLRTRFIDDFVRTGLADGLAQVVLLGAGFDARALRLPEIEAHGARVFEIDFASQLDRKRTLLADAGVKIPSWVELVACDLSDPAFEVSLLASLRERGFRSDTGTLFVWEGVIAYLSAEAVDRSLRFMASAGGPGSRVTFDFAPVAFGDEPPAERVHRLGWSTFEQVGYDELWRRHLPTEPHANAAYAYMGTGRL